MAVNKKFELRDEFQKEKGLISYDEIPMYADWLEDKFLDNRICQICEEKKTSNARYSVLADVGELIRIIEIFTDYVDMNADRFNKIEREMIIDIETQLEKVRANVS